jgi:transglutaminase-like putative cysteine protease/predicted Zn-dependent protease
LEHWKNARKLPAVLCCCVAGLLSTPATAQPWEVAHFSTDAQALHAQASAVSSPEGTDVVVLDDEDSYVFDAQGGTVHTTYVVYKVLSQNGAEGWSGIEAGWEPWHQDRPRIRARVIQPDGKAYELEQKAIADTPAAQESSDVYSDRRVLRAPLPAVAPGSVVEQEIISTSRELFPGSGSAARVYFGRWVPVQHTRLTVEAPLSLPLRYRTLLLPDVLPKIEESQGRRRWVFESGPLAPFDMPQADLPPDVAVGPHVDLSSTADWATLAQHYGDIVDRRIGQADLGAQAGKLLQGLTTREARIQAIVEFLNKEIRYTGVEFGEAAIVPRTPAETLGSKYGDCKDKATLLAAMLRGAGIPAYLALLNVGTREDISPELPGADFFDHAIVYVPGEQPLWIDATAQYARLGHLPSGDQGRYALVVRQDNTALQRIPEAAPQDNLLQEDREIDLADHGAARVVEISHPHGSFDSMYRIAYADGKNKRVRENLADYMKKQYLADALDRMDTADAADLGSEFRLELESRLAKRGYTDLDAAAAAIRLGGLFSNLPGELQDRPAKGAKNASAQPPKKRTEDYYLRLPHVVEWRYRIVPPAGFVPQALPKDATMELGPARLSESFSADNDGVVHANLRFDTVKRRFSVAEGEEMGSRIAELMEAPAIMVRFEPAGEALMRRGKWREAFQSYRDLIARDPKSAVQHLRRAYALLGAGFGEAARAEARLAVRLDPKSALAQAGLAHVLEHDLAGRQWRRGSDLAGAAAAMRAAAKLAPDEASYRGYLAVILEHDADGLRYSEGADLKGAIAEYATLTTAELSDLGFRENPAFTLFYAGRFAEAKKALDGISAPPQALATACEAALNGAQAGITLAGSFSSDEDDVKTTLRTAGDMLEKIRQYALAADLMEAGASGSNAVRTMNTVAVLRKARRHETLHFDDTAEGTVMRWVAAIMDRSLSAADYEAGMSRNARTANGRGSDIDNVEALVTGQSKALGRTEFSPAVLTDLMITASNHQAEGNDAAGYRVSFPHVNGGGTPAYFTVREDGRYRILTALPELSALGLEALDRIAAGDLASARTLLDWARDEQHLAGGDDPLEGSAFPHLWNKGQEADAGRMTLAAAALLVQRKPTSARGVSLLEAAGPGLSQAERAGVDLALLSGYAYLHDHQHELEAATRLALAYPQSDRAYWGRSVALRELGRYDEALELGHQKLAQDPGNLSALIELAQTELARGNYREAYSALRPATEQGKGGSRELNFLAWDSLFFEREGGPDVEDAEKAAQLAPRNFPVLHTLASVYAETGQIKQAREILLQAMEVLHLDEPNDGVWYVMGRLAEQYGERDIALDCYGRIATPAGGPAAGPDSTYRLTQIRLGILRTGAPPAQAGALPGARRAS